MKASERLRELERAAFDPNGRGPDNDLHGEPLLMALPLIADVVEAAESVTFFGQEAHRYNEWAGSRIVLALTALTAALQPEKVEPPPPDPRLTRWASGKRGSPPPPEGATAP